MTQAIILFAHGARDPSWSRPFEAVAARVQQLRPEVPVVLAYLEFMSPTLTEAGQALAQSGTEEVLVVPMFLGAGGHVRRDLPALMDDLRQRHPRTRWVLRPAIGQADSVVEAMAREVAASEAP